MLIAVIVKTSSKELRASNNGWNCGHVAIENFEDFWDSLVIVIKDCCKLEQQWSCCFYPPSITIHAHFEERHTACAFRDNSTRLSYLNKWTSLLRPLHQWSLLCWKFLLNWIQKAKRVFAWRALKRFGSLSSRYQKLPLIRIKSVICDWEDGRLEMLNLLKMFPI